MSIIVKVIRVELKCLVLLSRDSASNKEYNL
jgi:hypothetical protein